MGVESGRASGARERRKTVGGVTRAGDVHAELVGMPRQGAARRPRSNRHWF